jgi:hypothetical protein
VSEIALHEVGHLIDPEGNPDYAAELAVAPIEEDPADVVATLQGVDAHCHFCEASNGLAICTMDMDGTRQRAHLRHQVPRGLGGLIPATRKRLLVVLHELDEAEPLLPGRSGQFDMVREMIGDCQVALSGNALGPDDISQAHKLLYRAWDANFDLVWAYYMLVLYGQAE